MKNWFKRNKKILKWLGILFVLFFLVSWVVFVLMFNNYNEVQHFLQTKELSDSIIPLSLIAILWFIIFITFFTLFFVLVIKIFFPNSLAFSSIVMKKEMQFIKDMPSKIRKEVIKDE